MSPALRLRWLRVELLLAKAGPEPYEAVCEVLDRWLGPIQHREEPYGVVKSSRKGGTKPCFQGYIWRGTSHE